MVDVVVDGLFCFLAVFLGIVVVLGDSDFEFCRAYIERF